MQSETNNKAVISIDVEDAVSLAMRNFFGKRIPPTERVVINTQKMLILLQKHGVKATFFVLGEVAETYPELIREIDSQGHEIGVHGNSHIEFFRMTPEQALKEVTLGKKVIETIIGKKVVGHRAPAFSVNADNAWVFEVLAEAGFEYDSSVVPVATGRYGWEGFRKDIHVMSLNNNRKLVEVPLSTCRIMGKDIPVCGGGYFRLFPYALTKYAFRKIQKERPVIMYFHPHEVDLGPYPDFYMKEIRGADLKKKLRIRSYWLNRSSTEGKMTRILSQSKYMTMRDLITSTLDSSSTN